MNNQKLLTFAFCFIFIILSFDVFAIDRRKPQFQTEPSYLILPIPVSLPGIGDMVVVTGLAGNIMKTNTDLIVLGLTGDVNGMATMLEDIHLMPETLILSLFKHNISNVTFNNYSSRGMDSDPNDYTLIEQTDFNGFETRLTLSLIKRRIELFGVQYNSEVTIARMFDPDGNLIAELSPGLYHEAKSTTFGGVVDYTDDRQDPRKGLRLQTTRVSTPNDNIDEPEFNVWDNSMTVYIPVGKISTIAINYFQSDAEVTREGQTNLTVLEQELGINCFGNLECETAKNNLVQNNWAGNKYGTASPLGGDMRLRGYPLFRFSGAHTRYIGAEFRWNLFEGYQPFDWLIWKDIKTGSQIAFFYETATVADTIEDLGKVSKSNLGVGFRLVTASGFVYRPEVAVGDEGASGNMTFSYPW